MQLVEQNRRRAQRNKDLVMQKIFLVVCVIPEDWQATKNDGLPHLAG